MTPSQNLIPSHLRNKPSLTLKEFFGVMRISRTTYEKHRKKGRFQGITFLSYTENGNIFVETKSLMDYLQKKIEEYKTYGEGQK